MLAEFFPEFAEKLDEIDAIYAEKRPFDEKTYQLICCALSIKGRSKPCVLKHFKGTLEAGADDCWTHDVIGDWKEIIAGNIKCSCDK